MADVMIFAIAIASAISLLIVSPHEAQRKALRALRACGETEALPTGGRGEDLARPARGIFTSDFEESAYHRRQTGCQLLWGSADQPVLPHRAVAGFRQDVKGSTVVVSRVPGGVSEPS